LTQERRKERMKKYRVTIQTVETIEMEAENEKIAERVALNGEQDNYEWVSAKVLKTEEVK